MDQQYIFVYGTLMSEHPEHESFCPTPISAKPASIPGSLYQLTEGYPILSIHPRQIIARATNDPVRDWKMANDATTASPGDLSSASHVVFGELLEYPLDVGFLEKMDEWEGFSPWQSGIYQRVIARAKRSENGTSQICWMYACVTEPSNAIKLATLRWRRPDWLAFE